MRTLSLALTLSLAASAQASVVGIWKSDCQNVMDGQVRSIAPVDTFRSDGTASLKVIGYSDLNCQGNIVLEQTYECTYRLGNLIPDLGDARELDLECRYENEVNFWFDLALVDSNTLHFGNETGLTPESRPKVVGNIAYRRQF